MGSCFQSDIVLGEKYRDTQTDFEGVANAVMFQLYGCQRVQLRAMVSHAPAEHWFDLPALKRVDNGDMGFSTNTKKQTLAIVPTEIEGRHEK
jgi:hypothetical protein